MRVVLSLFFSLFLLMSGVYSKSDVEINADFFEFDAKNKQILANGHVVVLQKDIRITSNKAFYDQSLKKINLYENVVISKGGMDLYCDEAIAYGQDNKVEAKGHVKFNSQNISGKSGLAYYDIDAQYVELLQSPVVQQGEDYITGDVIEVDLKEQKVKTKGNGTVKFSLDKL